MQDCSPLCVNRCSIVVDCNTEWRDLGVLCFYKFDIQILWRESRKLRHYKVTEANCPDGIDCSLLKLAIWFLACYDALHFNYSIDLWGFLANGKTARIVPLYKEHDLIWLIKRHYSNCSYLVQSSYNIDYFRADQFQGWEHLCTSLCFFFPQNGICHFHLSLGFQTSGHQETFRVTLLT